MSDVKFSVAMCVYGQDNPEWFGSSVNSVINQTKLPDEIVIVVDGPVSIELNNVITGYEQLPLFKIIRLETNQGHGVARRVSIEHCVNELIALMDADDISTVNRFEKELTYFESDKELSVVGGNIAEFVGNVDHVIGERIVRELDGDIKRDMRKRCPMNQVSVMFKKTAVESVGGYVDWFCEEDYYLWLRMYLAGLKFANIQETLVSVRVGKDMYRRRGGLKYFISEVKLQKYMLDNNIIGCLRFMTNICERLIVQILLPNRLRGWIFKKFARKNIK